jgi:porin
MPFIRGAWADAGGSLLQKSLSVGMGRQVEAFSGLVGVGVNWGEPNEDTFGPGLSDQYAVEAFYRIPLGKRFAVTADVQYIRDPALNPDESSLWMLNGRLRFAF